MRISDWSSDVCSSDLLLALGLGHGGQDRALALDHLVVDAAGGELLLHLADAGQHAEAVAEAAHLAELLELLGEVVEIELALLHLAGELLRLRSEGHTSELPSLMRISYSVFFLNK